MNPSPAQSRADEVWRRFVGMFGGDSVERKYGRTPPPEWTAMLSKLKDFEIDRGVRRLAYSGRDALPSLPAFTKLCRAVQDDAIDEGSRPLALSGPDNRQFDRWDIAGNYRLLAYILRAGVERRYYDAKATEILVGYKQAWTTDMREGSANSETGEVVHYVLESQQKQWDECMRRAEEQISALQCTKGHSP